MLLPEELQAAIRTGSLTEWSDASLRSALATCATAAFRNENELRMVHASEAAILAELSDRAARARHSASQRVAWWTLVVAALTLLAAVVTLWLTYRWHIAG